MFYPKISIITPNFNGGKYIEETIQSVLCQNYPNLEYIIIDGGSTDNSVEIIKRYESQLAFWSSEPDNGLYFALQKGFEVSSGELMAWINSDDMYHKNSFYTVAEIFGSFPTVKWLLGASTVYDELNRTILVNQSRVFTKYDFYDNDFEWIQQESVFWRRSIWEQAGSRLDVSLKFAGDFELWLRFFKCSNLFITNALIGGFRQRRNNQLSLDHFEEYLYEVSTLLNNLKLDRKEAEVLNRYQKFKRFIGYFKPLRFINTDKIIMSYRSRYFQNPSILRFDRLSGRFLLP